ncbi:chromosome partitioning protein ParA [Tamlana sp. 2_MG-2023]|uniref:chromosome partitioning protein ParA n=1 Tax=unclassified Tamlana TaxID=2614803 RepID=UPI0026E1C618|nr:MULTISPECIES: chromosome partitioning protein ParA [unclassified Tamlana]MDO6759372.1 chromosome partitioning protein ParA [Tamlana sp. 2_MG-2023]MDO6790489.1 chromosome partitioning protein ParA [Tamlana sp. 1_MG-2023]
MENNKTSSGLKIALGIAIVLFLGTAFYTMNLYKQSNDDKKELVEQKQLVMNDLNAMAKQYDDAINESEITNNNLIEARGRIQGLIDSLKISETNVKSLWRYKQKYVSLQKEMDAILAQNDSLRIENSYLATSLDSTRVRLEERTVFTDSLLVQNNALAEVVENASILNTLDLKGSGVIERTSGKVIPTERARRADKIRVCFTVAKNALVQAGDQELYVQVIDPKNNTLGLNEQVEFEDKILNYSIISKFNYENANLNICEFVALKGDADFEKGRYIVNVFNQKDLVSTSEFTLK